MELAKACELNFEARTEQGLKSVDQRELLYAHLNRKQILPLKQCPHNRSRFLTNRKFDPLFLPWIKINVSWKRLAYFIEFHLFSYSDQIGLKMLTKLLFFILCEVS